MNKILLAIITVSLIAGGLYFAGRKNPDETKTTQESEAIVEINKISTDTSLSSIDKEIKDTKLNDFGAEIDALDESINQL